MVAPRRLEIVLGKAQQTEATIVEVPVLKITIPRTRLSGVRHRRPVTRVWHGFAKQFGDW